VGEEDTPEVGGWTGKGLIIAGFIGTGVYGAAIAIYALQHHVWSLPPAEFGSFVGGVVGPLAFLWLVLGFFQQGTELQHSVRALELQGQELRNSVDQQKALVDLNREQLEHEKAERRRLEEEAELLSQPSIGIQSNGSISSSGHRSFEFLVANAGATCTNVRFGGDRDHGQSATWAAGEGHTVAFHFAPGLPISEQTLVIRYTDARGRPGEQTFVFSPQPGEGKSILIAPSAG
jgi:hypothetical protein